ncbi:MAG: AraC family transcriptional regulator [Bacteroidota bacterium]
MSVYKTHKNVLCESEKTLLEEIEIAIEKHVSDPYFGVDQLAQLINLSRSQLTRRFSRLSGTTPGKRIQQMRLSHASERLKNGWEPIKSVALTSGFLNYQSFWKAFVEAFDSSPSEFRASHQGIEVNDERSISWCIPLSNKLETDVKGLVRQNQWLAHLFHILMERITDPSVTLEFLANHLCISPSQLTRKLKMALDITPMKLQQHLRLLLAADLLTGQAIPISRVAYQSGFFDQAHLCHSFKEAFGIQPSEYRKKNTPTCFLMQLKEIIKGFK